MKIAIIGARGCVGSALVKKILETTDHTIVASFRRDETEGLTNARITWRRINLYDDLGTEEFIGDADVLVYLVHSLKVKEFRDRDREFADRVGKFAKKNGVKRIVYLGGIIPPSEDLSEHLKSRMETGISLAAHGVPVFEVRASILLGICSASFQMIYWLARRLPIVIMPKWSNAQCSPISLGDTVEVLVKLIDREPKGHEIFEIGSGSMGYDDLIKTAGGIARGKANKVIMIPFFPRWFFAWWIWLITGVPRFVVEALLESIKNDTASSRNRFFEITGHAPKSAEAAIQDLDRIIRRTG